MKNFWPTIQTEYVFIYTDSSKYDRYVNCAVVRAHQLQDIQISLINFHRTIYGQMGHASNVQLQWNLLVFTNSFSAPKFLSNLRDQKQYLIAKEIISIFSTLSPLYITFAEQPGYKAIAGNEKPYEFAKQVATLLPTPNNTNNSKRCENVP